MTLKEFADVFGALAVQLRQTDADVVTIRAYYEPMKELEIEFVKMAAERLARTAEWFPKTSEWRDAAIKIESDRTYELRQRLAKLPSPLCLDCDDTGWARNAETDCVSKCGCRHLRRLEILGRRPMPALTDGSERTVQIDAEAVARSLAITSVMP